MAHIHLLIFHNLRTQEYGKVPKYIKERKKQLQEEKQRNQEEGKNERYAAQLKVNRRDLARVIVSRLSFATI